MRRIAPLLVLGTLLAVPAAPAGAQAVPATLSVTGEGIARLAPDLAVVNAAFERRDKDAVAARNSVNRRAQRLIASATALGVARADIQTGEITLRRSVLRPLHRGGPQRIRYTAATTVTMRVTDVSRTGPVLDAATAAGASGLDGPNFDFADASAGRAAAEKAAVLDARKRADAAAALVGQKVVGVQSLDLNPNAGAPVPEQQKAAAGSSAPAAPTPVSAGTEEFDATVDAVFLIAPQ